MLLISYGIGSNLKMFFLNRGSYPLFSGVSDHMICAMACIGIGCDVYPGGLKNFGPSKIYKVLQDIMNNPDVAPTDRFNMFASVLAKIMVDKSGTKTNEKLRLTSLALITLAKAFVYEPCNEEGKHGNVYLYGRPEKLESYLKEFCSDHDDVTITHDLKVLQCNGFGCGPHTILEAAEQLYTCSTCGVSVCHFCCDKVQLNSIRCLVCFRAESFAAGNDVTEKEMRATLQKYDQNVPTSATYRDVMQLYEEVVDEKRLECFHDKIKSVDMPSQPSSFFNHSSKCNLLSVKVSELSRVVRDERLSPELLCDFVTFLSALVVTDSHDTTKDSIASGTMTEDDKYKMYAANSAMPGMFVYFAKHCHIHLGLWSLKQAIQHA